MNKREQLGFTGHDSIVCIYIVKGALISSYLFVYMQYTKIRQIIDGNSTKHLTIFLLCVYYVIRVSHYLLTLCTNMEEELPLQGNHSLLDVNLNHLLCKSELLSM